MSDPDYELEFLLSLDGQEFRFASGYRIKIEVRKVEVTNSRPHGIKYSLTLHDQNGRRIYGMDNAHGTGRRREFDHRHVYGTRKIVGYRYRTAGELLNVFYREAERILRDRGGMA